MFSPLAQYPNMPHRNRNKIKSSKNKNKIHGNLQVLCQVYSRLSYVSDKHDNYHCLWCSKKGNKIEALPSEWEGEHKFICHWGNKENYCYRGESCNLSYYTVAQTRNLLWIQKKATHYWQNERCFCFSLNFVLCFGLGEAGKREINLNTNGWTKMDF